MSCSFGAFYDPLALTSVMIAFHYMALNFVFSKIACI